MLHKWIDQNGLYPVFYLDCSLILRLVLHFLFKNYFLTSARFLKKCCFYSQNPLDFSDPEESHGSVLSLLEVLAEHYPDLCA